MVSYFPVYDISTITGFRREDLLISRLKPYAETHKHLHFPHRHNFYHLLLFTEGSGSHSIDFQSFQVKPDQIYFMVPGQVHSWSFDQPVDGYVVNFSHSFFQSFLLRSNYLEAFSFFNGEATNSVIDIPGEIKPKIITLFDDMLAESEASGQLNIDLIRVQLLTVFLLLSRLTSDETQQLNSTYNYTLLKNFKHLIEKNFKTLKLPKEYAELLYITPNHLNALCNDLLGVSAGELIRNRIILESRRLLINLDLSISEISHQLNFSDNSYFTKFFKKATGVTPEEFRKHSLNKNYENTRI